MDERRAVLLHKADTVANLTEDAKAGERVLLDAPSGEAGSVVSLEDIPFGFKIAIKEIHKGEEILKYNHPIGVAIEEIPAGNLVHVHNIEGIHGRGDRQESAT